MEKDKLQTPAKICGGWSEFSSEHGIETLLLEKMNAVKKPTKKPKNFESIGN